MFTVGQTVFVAPAKNYREQVQKGDIKIAKITEIVPVKKGVSLHKAEADNGYLYRFFETPASSPYMFLSREELLLILEEGLKESEAKTKMLKELYQKYQN